MSRTSPTDNPPSLLCFGVLLCCLSTVSSAGNAEDISTPRDRDLAFSLYAGRLSDSNAGPTLLGRSDFVHSNLVAGAVGWTFKRAGDRSWSLEVEGNVAKHYGIQDNWEFTAMITGRWHRFPWNHVLATSLAFGLGPSYATEVPKWEAMSHDGSSERLLAFWQTELTLGPPKAAWAVLLRLHHRSTAWGLFGPTGGSNALTAGVRVYY